jgi:hypothetical protein
VSFGEEVDKQIQQEIWERLQRQGWTKVIHEPDMICITHRKGKNKSKPLYAEIHNDGRVVLLGAKQ